MKSEAVKGTRSKAARVSGTAVETVPFSAIQHAVAKQFEEMKKAGALYRVDLSGGSSHATSGSGGLNPEQRRAATGDLLWETYLASFPDGTNPVFRERTEHDCSCCRQFVKTVGAVVAIGDDGRIQTIWDTEATGSFYDVVLGRMDALVRSGAVDNVFLHPEKVVGVEKTFEDVVTHFTDGPLQRTDVVTWNHFHVRLPNYAVAKKDQIGPKLADRRATFDVLKRGLSEITLDAVDTVLDLIAQNSLYRGEEQRFAVTEFRKLKVGMEAVYNRTQNEVVSPAIEAECANYVWQHASTATHSVSRIRNTAVGTLLTDLSEGLDLDAAVSKFEAIMAPANYKRPTALVTKAMVDKARAKIEELGLTSALERRYAAPEDVTVANALFVDRPIAVRSQTRDVFGEIAAAVPAQARSFDKVEEVPVDKFLADILPRAQSLEVLFENRHAGNLVSLVAPVDPGSPSLFKWPNNFSWSYAGDFADSIKERVKKAGGAVTGDLCCRLAWDYTDDLDFHMYEPNEFGHIYYGNVRRISANGGMLDLDANGCDGMKADPVENIFYADKGRMRDGVYTLRVHNYNRRSGGSGFEVEVEFDGVTHSFTYDKALRASETVEVAQIEYSRKDGFKLASKLASSQTSKRVWGLTTQQWAKVGMVTLSPNWWEGCENPTKTIVREKTGEPFTFGVGNRHLFFLLDGCRNEGTARPFYNEFLRSDLEPHRKTLEMVGARMRTDEQDRQLSGLGFSSTQRSSVLVRVKGAFERVVRVVF